MIHGLLRISCSHNPKTPQIRSFFYEKWLLFGVLRVNKSCKHERLFDLLTLASSFYFQFQKLRLGNHRNPQLLRLLVF